MNNIDDFNSIADKIFDINIAVIHGGDKNKKDSVINVVPYKRSFKSYEVVANDIKNSLERIGFKNIILLADDSHIIENIKKYEIDLVWLNTGGTQGKNPMSHTPSILEMLGVPYIGHSPLATNILDSKHIFKHMCNSLNVKTSKFAIWNEKEQTLDEFMTKVKDTFEKGPFIAKPIAGRASLSVYHAKDFDDLKEKCARVFEEANNMVLVEKFLSGKEYCVAVSGHILYQEGKFIDKKEPFVFSEVERMLEPDEKVFTSMDTKKITANRTRLIDYVKESKIKDDLNNIASKIYKGLNLSTLVRVDIRADEKGDLYVLEANPKPDLKMPEGDEISLVSIGFKEYNLSYDDFIFSTLMNSVYSYFINEPDTVAHIKNKLI
jgi:D-alanine-D-alanine ligase